MPAKKSREVGIVVGNKKTPSGKVKRKEEERVEIEIKEVANGLEMSEL
jgi:hypothetical protein